MKILSLLIASALTLMAVEFRTVLEPDEAFKVTTETKAKYVEVKFVLAKDIYIYDEELKFSIIQPKKISLNKSVMKSKSVVYHDTAVHLKDFVVVVPFKAIQKATDAKEVTLQVGYQGCSKVGICYPPIVKKFEVKLP